MPYKKELAKKSNTELSENRKSYYLTGQWESEDCEEYAMWFIADDSQAEWDAHKAKITKEWNKHHPCARCWAWWEFDAPELRQWIEGKGETEWEKYPAIMPYYSKGIPASWARIDEKDPPCYESEATFLDRHGFLSTTEKTYLAKHPELLQPERIEDEKV